MGSQGSPWVDARPSITSWTASTYAWGASGLPGAERKTPDVLSPGRKGLRRDCDVGTCWVRSVDGTTEDLAQRTSARREITSCRTTMSWFFPAGVSNVSG